MGTSVDIKDGGEQLDYSEGKRLNALTDAWGRSLSVRLHSVVVGRFREDAATGLDDRFRRCAFDCFRTKTHRVDKMLSVTRQRSRVLGNMV